MACGGATGRPSSPAFRSPDGSTLRADPRAFAELPALQVKPDRGRYILSAFRDEDSWRRFARAARLDPSSVRVDFRHQILVAVADTSPATTIRFYGWLAEHESAVLLIDPDHTELAIIEGNNLVLVAVASEGLRDIRLVWTMQPNVDAEQAPLSLGGGTVDDTLTIPRPGELAPARAPVVALPTWGLVALDSLSADATLPEGAKIQAATPGNALIKLSPGVRVSIARIHEDESLHRDLPALAEDVASGRCQGVSGVWSIPTKQVPQFSVTECRAESSGAPPGTAIRATARDRILHVGFHCEATIDGAAAESESKILDVHRVCGSLEGNEPLDRCQGLPGSLTSPHALNGFVSGGRLGPDWFREQVRWGEERRPISRPDAVRRAQGVGLEAKLASSLSHPLACPFHAGGTVKLVSERCAVEFELDPDSRSGPIWRIAAVSCT